MLEAAAAKKLSKRGIIFSNSIKDITYECYHHIFLYFLCYRAPNLEVNIMLLCCHLGTMKKVDVARVDFANDFLKFYSKPDRYHAPSKIDHVCSAI